MKLLGDQTFADAGFSGDQNSRVDGSQSFGQSHDVMHALAAGNNISARCFDPVYVVEGKDSTGIGI